MGLIGFQAKKANMCDKGKVGNSGEVTFNSCRWPVEN